MRLNHIKMPERGNEVSAYNFSISDAMKLAAENVSIEGWQGHTWRSAGAHHIVEGCVPFGNYISGKNKGRPRFRHPNAKNEQTVVVTRAELIDAATRYEKASGKCWDCKGTGKVWAGWSAAEGTKHRDCKRCSSTGRCATTAHNPTQGNPQ